MTGHKLTSGIVRIFTLTLLFACALIFGSGCIKKEPVRVGFVAELSGRQSELGVQERNGAQLAVEAINASGGVAGRSIELITRDDLGTPEGAKKADRELIAAGVVAIIGHATSKQTEEGLPVTDAARVVMISPTTSASQLSGISSYFFRVTVSNLVRLEAFARHIFQHRGMRQIAIIYDNDNAAYAKSYSINFIKKFQSMGGTVVAEIGYSSSAQPDFAALITKLRSSGADSLLIIASDFETALISQLARLNGWQVPLFTSAWAHTDILLQNGGRAVEGLELEQAFPINPESTDYLDFRKRFQSRFDRAPSFGASCAYETVMVLAHALKKTGGKPEGLREALHGIREFKGLIDKFSFDKNGDVVRPFYIGGIHDGKFVTSKTYKPQDK